MRHLCIPFFCIILAANAATVRAGEPETPEDSGEIPAMDGTASGDDARHGRFLRQTRQAVLLCINARIMGRDRVVSWTETHRKITKPGNPVELKLVGANVIVAVQFTPYVQRGGTRTILVAQGQVWMETPDRGGIRYHASVQTIPVSFGDPIYFFPLGPVREGAPSLEVMLTIYPYEDGDEI